MNRLAHNTSERRILNLLGDQRYAGTEILFHHRFPTSTDNVQNACHPFSTKSNQALFDHNYVLVHNGHVSNAYDLKEDHAKLGITYVSEQASGKFNDSEALLYDVALYLDGKQDELTARGSIAFVVKTDDGRTFFGRNYGSPLVYNLTVDGISVSSEGEGVQVEANKLYEFLPESKSFIVTPLTIPGYATTPYSYTTYQPAGHQTNWWEDDDATRDYMEELMSEGNDDGRYYAVTAAEYREALAVAKAFGSTEDAIAWYDKKIKANDTVLVQLQAIDDEHPTPANAKAVDQMLYEQDMLETELNALYEVLMDEEAMSVSTRSEREYDYAD